MTKREKGKKIQSKNIYPVRTTHGGYKKLEEKLQAKNIVDFEARMAAKEYVMKWMFFTMFSAEYVMKWMCDIIVKGITND